MAFQERSQEGRGVKMRIDEAEGSRGREESKSQDGMVGVMERLGFDRGKAGGRGPVATR
jgi:hypothetical protein